jgi:uncharacterized DUF497 family protein
VEIVSDDVKRERNLRDPRLDFADAREHFDFDGALIERSYPGSDGRARFIAIGPLDGKIVTLIFSMLGTEAISVISLRRASRKERRRYDEAEA